VLLTLLAIFVTDVVDTDGKFANGVDAVHLDLEISPQIFGKIQNNPSVSAVLRIRDVYPGYGS
jgi:hypothetical protein